MFLEVCDFNQTTPKITMWHLKLYKPDCLDLAFDPPWLIPHSVDDLLL